MMRTFAVAAIGAGLVMAILMPVQGNAQSKGMTTGGIAPSDSKNSGASKGLSAGQPAPPKAHVPSTWDQKKATKP